MKKTFLLITILACSQIWASDPVSIVISDGIYNATIKAKMEKAMSLLFTEAGSAYETHSNLNLALLPITEGAKEDLSMLWENSKFICWENNVVQHCLTVATGYQVRNIPLELVDADEDDKYHEAVINFDQRGNMTSFNLAISNHLYMDIIKADLEVTDLRRRHLILDWTEHFRTAYNRKDLDFIKAVFSEDALIITGRVITSVTQDGTQLPPKVELIEKNKAQYLRDLAKVFKNNRYINVTFDSLKVNMHKVNPDVYGVELIQGYTSDIYHDRGHLFLLWDFRDETRPLIHVRAWQPDSFVKNGKRIPLQKITIRPEDFNI